MKIEYLDAKTYSGEEYTNLLTKLLRFKYKNLPFPLVITIDNAALNFYVKHNNSIFHNSPLVFCGVNEFSPRLLHEKTNYSGVAEINGYNKTLKIARELRPNAKAIYIITDNTPTSNTNLELLKKNASLVAPTLPLKLLQSLSISEIKKRLAEISPGDIVVLLSFWIAGEGKPTDENTIREVLGNSPTPVFSDHAWMLDYNVIGGFCINGDEQGRKAGEIALKILNGTPAEDIPVSGANANQYLFNHELFSKYKIDASLLPQNSIIINAPPPFYKVGKPLLITMFCGILLLGSLATALTLIIRQKRAAVKKLIESRNLYQTLAENIDLGICFIDTGYHILMCNQAFKRMFEIDDAIGKECFKICKNKNVKCEYCPGSETLSTDQSKYAEIKHKNKNGELIPIGIRSFPIHKDGKIYGFIEVTENLLKQHVDALKVRASEEKFHTIFNTVREAIFIHDIETGNIVDANASAIEMFGYTRQELLNSPVGFISSCNNEFTNTGALEAIQKAASGIPQFFEWQGRHKNGKIFWDEVSLQKVELGGQPRVIALVRNIDQRKLTEENHIEQIQQRQKIRKADAVAKLAGGIAHDINNLLGGILGGTEIIQTRMDCGETDFADIIKMIISTTQRATDLTDKLLALSKRELIALQKVNLHELLLSCIQKETVKFKPNIEQEKSFGARAHDINAEPAQLRNLFNNLICNACEAMPSGGKLFVNTCNATLKEEDCLESSGNLIPGEYIITDFHDTGCGIQQENLERIFEPFYTTKNHEPGRGLGLPSARGAALNHRGDITVKSSLGHGSTFTVFLPVGNSDEKLFEKHQNRSTRYSDTQNTDTPHKTILIIDDEPPIRNSLKSTILDMGFLTIEADNGEDGLNLYRQSNKNIALTVLDLAMPYMDGETCLHEILRINPDAKVIIISGHYPQVTEEIKNAVSSFIKKPFTRAQITNAIEDAMQGTTV